MTDFRGVIPINAILYLILGGVENLYSNILGVVQNKKCHFSGGPEGGREGGKGGFGL